MASSSRGTANGGGHTALRIPPALTGWLKSRYPTLPVRQEWLEGCVEYLLESGPGRARPSDRELIRGVNVQLLHSDLADSAERGVLHEDMLNMHKERIGERTRGVLLQVVGIMDVGVPAQTQLDVLAARKEARAHPPSVLPGGSSSSSAAGAAGPSQPSATYPSEQHGDPNDQAGADGGAGEDDHMAAFHTSESALAASANPTTYPRSVLRLHLSDGHSDVLMPAFEHSRVEALSMNDPPAGAGAGAGAPGRTELGCKVLLKGCEVRRGQVLLRPGEVEILGGSIPELEARAEYILTNSLRVRLGKPPEPEEMEAE